MKKIVFATNNAHKLDEIKEIMQGKLDVLSLKEIGFEGDIEETSDTLEGNAEIKARHIYDQYAIDCFADDTGLEIDALNGKPGVYSARYAGEPTNSVKNMEKVLMEMSEVTNRKACFRTVICLIENGKTFFFEGKIEGEISTEPKGEKGFGYDPIFVPKGYVKSFAELTADEKNTISHRALAVKELFRHFGYKI